MKYKTTYGSHESLEEKLNRATEEGWHLLQILPYSERTVTAVFYQDEPKSELTTQQIDNAIEDIEVLEPIQTSKWIFWKK